ncbi:MAG: iron-containing alcohol dehydrogenase [Candidatus Obscuribacterales bacterium]|nr:iron-containing alcohol dehydrogenase [Candidatus Obscuribacterales bacterium]
MNPFIFQSPTRVCFGEYISSTAYDLIQELGGNKPLLVTDDFLIKSGIINAIIDELPLIDGEHAIVSDVPPDSDIDCVNSASAYAREKGCDSIIAVGGGSVLDTAKVINICLTLGGKLLEHQGLNMIASKLLPMIAIPTTTGTGSEVSYVATVKDNVDKRKLIFGSRYLAPDAAILDPILTISLPPKLTAATGMDAITHNLESIAVACTQSRFTEALALESMKMLIEYLPRATRNGDDIEARSQTLVASTMAGIAFSNAGVGIIHALAHATGARFKTHHGMTNAVFLRHGIRFNTDTSASRYAHVARTLGIYSDMDDNEGTERLIDTLEQLMDTIQLPQNLEALGVPRMDKDQLKQWANLVIEDPAIMFNPKEASTEDVIDIFQRAY